MGCESEKWAFWGFGILCFLPILWIVSEGTGKISVYGEAIAYTILDILSKSVFGWVITRLSDPQDATRHFGQHQQNSGNKNAKDNKNQRNKDNKNQRNKDNKIQSNKVNKNQRTKVPRKGP